MKNQTYCASVSGTGHRKSYVRPVTVLLCLLLIGLFEIANAQFTCPGFSVLNVGYTGSAQTFTVPPGVTEVRISITGASGGLASSATNTAGGGASVNANINVTAGDVFRIIIGQKGTNGLFEAGGGGSSAVYKNGVLIMVAGAGAGEDNTGNGGNGLAAVNGGSSPADDAGGCVASVNNGRGGISGTGGNHGEFAANCPQGGGGGGGLTSAGIGNGNTNAGQPGGQGNINGAAGGVGAADDAPATNGGWGWSGGGGADDRESGGGGGYSGGGGGPESKNPGGGGSFVAAIGTNGISASQKADGIGTTTGFDGSGTICSSVLIVLPVTFTSFTAERQANGNLIRWSVAAEINTNYYEVQKSGDGINFVRYAAVPANGAAIAYNYSMTDSMNSGAKCFYRVMAVDLDNKTSYSGTRFVNAVPQKATLSIFPNPVTERLGFVLPQGWNGAPVRAIVMNSLGQVAVETNLAMSQNYLVVNSLAKGRYLLKLLNQKTGEQVVTQFIK